MKSILLSLSLLVSICQGQQIYKTLLAIPAPVISSTFSPTDISGLKAWWKADSLSGLLSDNNPVTTWTTSGGSSRDATSGLGVAPIYKANIQNGKPVVRFDATLLSGLAFTTEDISLFTVFVVYKFTSTASSYGGPVGWRTAGENGFQIVNENATDWTAHLVVWNGSSEIANYKQATTALVAPTSFMLEMWQSSPNFYRNSTNAGTASGGSGYSTGATTGRIGNAYNPISCDIGEIIIYNLVLNSTQRQQVETYLNSRWAVY